MPKSMLRQSAKEQVSLMRSCRNQKSQQAQSRGYKSCQARKMDLQVADRRDQRLMRCCGLMKVVLGNQNPP
jgi:hypothetical protein